MDAHNAADPAARPDTRCAQLADLRSRGRTARDLDLRGADLRGQALAGLRADGLDLSEADLRGCALDGVRWSGCALRDARLDAADLRGAVLRMCDLDQARATGACLAQARLENSTARAARLDGADLRGALLTDTDFARASLRGADLRGAAASGACFRGADLRGARLQGADLTDTDLRGADLTDTDLSDCDLRGADLRGSQGTDPARSGEQPAWGDLPPALRPLAETVAPVVQEALRTAGQSGLIDARAAERLAAEAARGASPRHTPDPQTLAAVAHALGQLGEAGLPALLGALQQPGPAAPPPEVQRLILRLRDELGLDAAADTEAVLARLLEGLGQPTAGAAEGRRPSEE